MSWRAATPRLGMGPRWSGTGLRWLRGGAKQRGCPVAVGPGATRLTGDHSSGMVTLHDEVSWRPRAGAAGLWGAAVAVRRHRSSRRPGGCKHGAARRGGKHEVCACSDSE
jgi:hypothetical protein